MQPNVNIESVIPIKADLASQEISLDVNDDTETKSICVQEIKEEKFDDEYLVDSVPESIGNNKSVVDKDILPASIDNNLQVSKNGAEVIISSDEKHFIKTYKENENVRVKLENNETEAAANIRGEGHGNEIFAIIKEEPFDHENAGSLLRSNKESFLFRHQPIKIEPLDS